MTVRSKITIGMLSFFVVGALCKNLNGNFDTKDLLAPTKSGSCWDIEQKECSLDVQDLLQQNFTYLGKGHQSFAFLSQDGNYVLKLFKPHYPNWETFLGTINFTYIPFAKWGYRMVASHSYTQRIKEDLTSYVNALCQFKKESCLEYIHLAKTTHLHTKIRFFDKMNIMRELDADSTCFLIQKKVTPIENTLKTLMQERKIDEARVLLQKLIYLLSKRLDLGFYKPTHKFHANFGCVGLEPVQLDVGRLVKKEDLERFDPKWKPDMQISLQKLRIWMEEHIPDLIPHVSDLLEGNRPPQEISC
jgi:hypothetical protein